MTQIPLYFLPGTQCDEQLWRGVFELLPAYFSPTAIVLPQENNLDDIVHALHQQLINLQQDKHSLNLIGFSLGGYLAALYARHYPNHLNKLLIISNAPFPLPDTELDIRSKTLTYINNHGYSGMPAKRIAQLLGSKNKQNQNIIGTIKAMDKRCGQAMLTQQLSSTSKRTNLIDQLTALPFEINFIAGSEDTLVSISTLTDELAGSRISINVIEDCGHMLPLESPQAIADHIITLFSQ